MSIVDLGNYPLIFTLLIIFCLSFWCKGIFSKYDLIPAKLLFIFFTIMVITIHNTFTENFQEKSAKSLTLPPFILHIMYFPLLTLKSYFTIDKYLFVNILPIIMFVSFITTLLNIALFASVIMFMWDWDTMEAIMFAVVLAPTQSQFLASFLMDHFYKKFKEELEGESVVGTGFILCYFELVLGLIGKDSSSINYDNYIAILCYKVFGGLIAGYIIGLLIIYFMKIATDDAEASAVVIYLFHLISYILLEKMYVSPYFALLNMGFVLMQNRDHIMEDNAIKITNFLETFYYISNFTVFTYCIFFMYNTGIVARPKKSILIYLIMMITRTCSFSISYPVLKWASATFSVQKFGMFVWSKVISNASLIMVLTLKSADFNSDKPQKVLSYVFVMMAITHSLNSISFVYLAKRKMLHKKNIHQLTNIIDALKDIYRQKAVYITMWKMKSVMADVRWDVVDDSTQLKMPYNRDESGRNDGHMLLLAPKKATCPDCNIVVVAELTTKDKTDMKIEATRRILKEMTMHLIRLHTLGLITTECTLVITKMINDSDNIVIDMTEVQSYLKNNKFLEFVKKIYSRVVKFNEKAIKRPRKPCRKFCYDIIMTRHFRRTMFIVYIASIYPIIVFVISDSHHALYYSAAVANYLFTLIFIINMVMTVYAYSFVYIKEGFKIYFSSYCHIFDFLILIMAVSDVATNTFFIITNAKTEWNNQLYYSRLFRLIVILKICQGQFLQLLRLFEEFVDVRVAFGFEIIKTFRNCYDEVLLTLSKTIGNNYELEMECRQNVENGRWAVLEMLLYIQLEKPFVAVSVKTRHVMTAVIKSMYGTLFDLKKAGFLDDFEFEKLKTNLKYVEMRRSSIGKKLKSGLNEMITGIAWMTSTNDILDYIIESSTLVHFNADTEIVKEDDVLEGIFVVIKGVMKIEYTPRISTMEQLLNKGRLPVIDFIETNTFDRHRYELILPGNTFGELCYLTNRAYDAKITTICEVEAIIFTTDIITEAIRRDEDTINGFGSKMWKVTIHDMCLWILSSQHVFENLSTTEMRQKLERSFIPNLRGFRNICVNSEIEDLILIDGQIENSLVKETFNAPCYIPRHVTSFVLSLNEDTTLNSVILIIPTPEADITMLETKLIETAGKAHESDEDFQDRQSKVSPYNPIVPKGQKRRIAQSSLFNPLQMLKLYRKSKT